MSEPQLTFSQQRRKGIVLASGAIFILVGGAALFQYYDFPPIGYLGLMIPSAVLVFYSYRNISASRNQTAVQDERSIELHRKAGLDSFWILVSIISVDSFLHIFPSEARGDIYLISGVLAYALVLSYYKYIQ